MKLADYMLIVIVLFFIGSSVKKFDGIICPCILFFNIYIKVVNKIFNVNACRM